MKKTFFIFAVLITMSSVVFAGGIDDPKSSSKIVVVKKDESHVRLIYKSNKVSNVEVAIFNKKNELQFTEVIRKVDGFARPYDLSSLQHGAYTIVVKNDSDESLSEAIEISAIKPSLLTQVITMKENNKFVLTVADKKSNYVTIRVTDEESTVLYEKRESLKGQMAKLFSFKGTNNLYIFTIIDPAGNTVEVIKRNVPLY
jgi:hypothetical protein